MKQCRHIRITLATAALSIAAAASAHASTLTWTATTPGSLIDPANWTPSVAPSSADTLTFSTPNWPQPSLPHDLTVQALSVTDCQGTLDLATYALHVTGPFTYNTTNLNSALTITATGTSAAQSTLTAGSLTVAGGTPQWSPLPTLTLRVPTSVTGPITIGTADPAVSGGVVVNTWAPLTAGGDLTIGDGSYARVNAYAPVAADSVSIASNHGGANATFVSGLTTTGNAHIGDPTATAVVSIYGPTSIGGSLTIGAPSTRKPDYYSSSNLVQQDVHPLTVGGTLTINSTSELDLYDSAPVHANTVVNSGKFFARSNHVTANSFVNHGILEPHAVTIDAPYTQAPDATLYFLVDPGSGDPWNLTLTQSTIWQGGTINVLLQNGWTPSPGNRIDLISAPGPLPISPGDVHLVALPPSISYSLDTSHGLSVVFVPEPTGALVAATGLAASLLPRRRPGTVPYAAIS